MGFPRAEARGTDGWVSPPSAGLLCSDRTRAATTRCATVRLVASVDDESSQPGPVCRRPAFMLGAHSDTMLLVHVIWATRWRAPSLSTTLDAWLVESFGET